LEAVVSEEPRKRLQKAWLWRDGSDPVVGFVNPHSTRADEIGPQFANPDADALTVRATVGPREARNDSGIGALAQV